jgi:hypothetical protein
VQVSVDIPGLDRKALYVSRLSARSALFTDFQVLLEGRNEALSADDYRQLVVDGNCLSRSSSMARKKIWQELRSRYRLNAEDRLFRAFWTEWSSCHLERERGLTAYVLFALNDRLVMDLGVEWLFPILRSAPRDFKPDDVNTFISARSRRDHPEVLKWSEGTRMAVAQKYCASLRDFGLASGVARKSSIRPALYGAPTRLLIRALELAGRSPLEIVGSRAFRLLGIDSHEVVDALGDLNRIGALRFRMQGDVVELDLPEAA